MSKGPRDNYQPSTQTSISSQHDIEEDRPKDQHDVAEDRAQDIFCHDILILHGAKRPE
ncbi:Hypothetical predicted protein [Mytilus galloprovincialis]|uniref:Uncharacterized protein n=1 Tax=Mytilus galloprovincialis TaxID=29158 RepID=A0A8B6HBD4_MYTGA|nr:Hypothetical predicted protein [Mytilus galloprovincialis]